MERSVFDEGKDIFDQVASPPEITDNFKDIYDFFEILHGLFKEVTLLEQYPDEEYKDGDVLVVYRMGEKKFFTHKSEGGFRDYTQVKPFELKSGYDLVTNNIKNKYANKFQTTISLEVSAGSVRDLMRVVKYVEALLIKHKGHLKCFVADFIYVGQTPTEFSQGYQNKRLFSRSLIYQVVTYETYTLVSEELKYIR